MTEIKQNTNDTVQNISRIKDINNNFSSVNKSIADEVTRATNAETTLTNSKANIGLDNITLNAALTNLGFAGQSLTPNGYFKFPLGLIVQWGAIASFSGSIVTPFSIQFPNACLNVQVTQVSGSGQIIYVPSWTNQNFTATKTGIVTLVSATISVLSYNPGFSGNYSNTVVAGSAMYLAIGH